MQDKTIKKTKKTDASTKVSKERELSTVAEETKGKGGGSSEKNRGLKRKIDGANEQIKSLVSNECNEMSVLNQGVEDIACNKLLLYSVE